MGATTTTPLFAFTPRADTAWAGVSVLLMWACYWANSALADSASAAGLAIFFIGGNLVVCTVLPAWVVTRVAGEGWAGLGFTRKRLWLSLGLCVVLGLGSVPYYLQLAGAAGISPMQHLVYNVLAFWEPLFVYGWLYLRFARAFGRIPAVVATAAGFAIYHLGSVPLATVAVFFGTGLVFAALMAITLNLWTIVPFIAGVSSAIGTVQAGLEFGWQEAGFGAVILAVQVVILVLLVGRWRPAEPGTTEPLPHPTT